jgi:hypothetical protein
LLIPNNDVSIADSSEVTADVLNALKHCPTNSYYIVEQPGVSSADYVDGRAAPQLSRYMAGQDAEIKTTLAIPEIVGQVDAAAITAYLLSNCGKEPNNDQTWFSRSVLTAPSTSKAPRVQQLQSHGRLWHIWNVL